MMRRVCCYCGTVYGHKEGPALDTHGICPQCLALPSEELDRKAHERRELRCHIGRQICMVCGREQCVCAELRTM